jgi:hypothetical protein
MTQENEQDAKKWEEERTMSFLRSHLTDFFNERLKEFDEQEARGRSYHQGDPQPLDG